MTELEALMAGILGAAWWIEQKGLRVGFLWLHPQEVEILKTAENFHPVTDEHVRNVFREKMGTPIVGHFYGASVFESEIVAAGHVAILPVGFHARLVDPSACFSLGLGR